MDKQVFDWSELAFASKKPLRELKATFIAAPRDISTKRFTQLVKDYLPKGNIIVGIAKEAYIEGFEDQPQFKTLHQATVLPIMTKVNAADTTHKIYIVTYFQRELIHILEKLAPSRAVFVNGSWKYSFHTLPIYYAVMNANIPYELISPFESLTEAVNYSDAAARDIKFIVPKKHVTAIEMLGLADNAAKQSFDYGFQTGVTLGRKVDDTYHFIAQSFNRVVPFQGFAMHYGASRETYFSPPNDLNHYDTVHAEMDMLVQAQKNNIDLHGTTMFINLMPCPTCARVLVGTDISQYVYRNDHSEGYAIKLFESCGKSIKRIV